MFHIETGGVVFTFLNKTAIQVQSLIKCKNNKQKDLREVHPFEVFSLKTQTTPENARIFPREHDGLIIKEKI